jgi:thioredoxin 1
MPIINITDANFDAEVLNSKMPVVVDIWAEWCGPCRLYSPVIDEVSKEYEGKIKFAKVNADECESVVQKYNVTSIPTTLLVKNGEIKAMNVGALPREALKKWITSNL